MMAQRASSFAARLAIQHARLAAGLKQVDDQVDKLSIAVLDRCLVQVRRALLHIGARSCTSVLPLWR